jgi:DNA-binding GntR family transcriptional regulator
MYERLAEHDAEGAAAVMEEHITGSWTARKQKRSES